MVPASSTGCDVKRLLDRFNIGIVVLDAERGVVLINRRAAEIVSAMSPIMLRHGRLAARSRVQDLQLQTFLSSSSLEANRAPWYSLALSGPDNTAPLLVLAASLGADESCFHLGRAAALVCLVDPKAGPGIPENVLSGLHSLTRREAKLLAALLCEYALPSAARRLNITLNTARSYLKRVFAKVGARNQCELVSLVVAGLAWARFDCPRSEVAIDEGATRELAARERPVGNNSGER